jgi:tetratricopeptide (TPR) repeat protein
LDDFHLVEDDPAFTRLVDRLQQVLTTASFSLLITTRRLPALTRLAPVEPLAGLNLTDARLLLVRRNVKLAEALIQQLHTLTAGNAQLLLLAIDLLHQASDGELLVDRLAAADHVEQYLLSAVDEGLSGRERAVMGAVAVLVGYPGTRAALEAILNSGNLWRTLHELHARHLLTVAEGAVDKRYSQHALLQQFYYQELSGQQRRHMHRRAGDYYAREEVDRLVAALHYERAGEYTLAAQEATRDVWGMINQGQAHTLVGVLERLQTAQLEINQWAQLCISQGLLCAFLGERKSASVHYRAVLAQLERLPAAPNLRELKARACRGLGELFELEHPPEALGWLQQGLAELQEMHSPEFAALQIRIGAVQMYGGNYTAALQALEIGLQHLPEGPSQLLSIALKNLGAVYGYQGDLQRAKEYALQALAINQQLHDLFEMNHILVNLGFLKDNLGDWPGAIADYQQAIALAGQLGSVQLQAAAELNLGALYVRTGEQAAALQHLQHSLAAAQTAHQYIIVILAYVNLADLFIRLRDWSQAENALNLAEELAVELEHKGSLIAIESAQAEIALAKGHHRLALDHAEQSIRLAREQGETLDEGASLRILGQVLRSTDQRSEAIAALSQSLELLEEKSPYEAARSKVQLGWALRTDGDRQRGEKLLQEARSTFADLGARHDLDLVEVV